MVYFQSYLGELVTFLLSNLSPHNPDEAWVIRRGNTVFVSFLILLLWVLSFYSNYHYNHYRHHRYYCSNYEWTKTIIICYLLLYITQLFSWVFIQGRGCTYSYCGKYESCTDCVQDPFCGWCDSSRSCLGGFPKGPPKRNCPDWFFYHCYTVGDNRHCSNNIQVKKNKCLFLLLQKIKRTFGKPL